MTKADNFPRYSEVFDGVRDLYYNGIALSKIRLSNKEDHTMNFDFEKTYDITSSIMNNTWVKKIRESIDDFINSFLSSPYKNKEIISHGVFDESDDNIHEGKNKKVYKYTFYLDFQKTK